MAAIQSIIPCEQIELHEQLGQGEFAEVKRGKWLQSSGQEVAVAVKILLDTSPNSAADLRNEMSHLKKLQHQYIVRFHGFVAQPPMLVFEFCEGGSLLDRLRDKNKPIPLVSILHDYCIQLAKALEFLETKHCVHRDVAARNILLTKDEKTAKLGDFGLTRTLDDDEDVYVMMSHTKVPFPWCPPEALRYGEFSHASDVWAFGVTIWEIFTFGEEPWVGCRPIDVLKNIDAGERLVKPTYCSENIYRIMKDCWKSNPAERCKFGAIREDLKASMILDAIARETYHSIQPGTLQLVKGDEVVVVENTGQDWFGQNKKNQKFGTFPRSVVFAPSNHAVVAASAVTPQKAPTAPTAPIPSHSTTSVSETPTSQQQNPLQNALTDELKGNLNRRPTSAGSTGNGSPLHRNGVSKVSQPISQQPLPPQVVPTNQAPKLSQPQQVRLPPPVITAPIANSHNGMTRPRQASAIGKQSKNGGNGRSPPAPMAPTPAAHASPPTARVVPPTKTVHMSEEERRSKIIQDVTSALPAQSALQYGSSSTSALPSTTSAGPATSSVAQKDRPQIVHPTFDTKKLAASLAGSEEEKLLLEFLLEECRIATKQLDLKKTQSDYFDKHNSTATPKQIKEALFKMMISIDQDSLSQIASGLPSILVSHAEARLNNGGAKKGKKGNKKKVEVKPEEETEEESEDEKEDEDGTTPAQSDDVEIANKNDYTKFVTKSDAVLWEDDYIQIGCKLETHKDSGRLDIVYVNKTSRPFNKFTPIITCPGALAAQLQAQAKPVKQSVAAGAQVKQLINFVCVQEFQEKPILNIKFSFTDRAGALKNFDKNFYLPLFISKFFEPTNMTSKQFSTMWKSLGSASQEPQKTFDAQSSMDTANIETKLKGFGATLLTDVDPNPKKYECAGIIHTQTQQIGTLIRLKPYKRAKTYHLTIRSSKDTVVQTLVDLLANQF